MSKCPRVAGGGGGVLLELIVALLCLFSILTLKGVGRANRIAFLSQNKGEGQGGCRLGLCCCKRERETKERLGAVCGTFECLQGKTNSNKQLFANYVMQQRIVNTRVIDHK